MEYDYNISSLVNIYNDIVEIGSIETISQILSIILIIAIIVVLLLRYLHKKSKKFRGMDMPDYIALLAYFAGMMDFWTDLLFCYSMYLVSEMILFYLSLLFVIIPLIMSIILLIYFINYWRKLNCLIHKRITDYLAKYSLLLIVLTIIGGFYPSIKLIQSRIGYLKMFNFSLKKIEKERIIFWRFINITLLEVM